MVIAASTPVPCSRAVTLRRPSASTWKVTRTRAAPAAIGGIPRNSNRASDRQSTTRSRSPCTTVDTHRRLAVLKRSKILGACDGNRGIAGDQLFRQTTHRLQPQRQRDDVKQQRAVAAITGKCIGLNRGANRNRLVGIDVGKRRAPEKPGNRAPHLWHPRRPADQYYAVESIAAPKLASRRARRTGTRVILTRSAVSVSSCARVRVASTFRPPGSGTVIAT